MTDEPHDLPITGHWRGVPLPDLRLIDRDRWFEALAPLDKHTRTLALSRCRKHELDDEMIDIWVQLMFHDGERQAQRDETRNRGVLPPSGRVDAEEAARERRRREAGGRQVNLRLVPADYRALADAADEHGLKPTQLARLLVVNGLRRIEYERRRLSGP